MCQPDLIRCRWTIGLLLFLSSPGLAEWRRVGNTALDAGLASPAGGPVDRVWFSPDGLVLYARSEAGKVFATKDFERWTHAMGVAPPAASPALPAGWRNLPEAPVVTRALAVQGSKVYAAGLHAYRSDDGGLNWTNLTAYRNDSILGGALRDAAVSPQDQDQVVVAGRRGIWRSMDGGRSWAGLNQHLPNLPVTRFLGTEPGRRVRIELADGGAAEWTAGEKNGWKILSGPILAGETLRRAELADVLGTSINSVAVSNEFQYAGSADGRVFSSSDQGATWRSFSLGSPVRRVYTDRMDGAFAIGLTEATEGARVFRTSNGGLFWENLSSGLPAGAVRGAVADRGTGAVYIATDRGVFFSYPEPAASAWVLLRPEAAVDVLLDAEGNQLYVAHEGQGVFATIAPHRSREPRVLSAGDQAVRPAAPGALLSVLGGKVLTARAGNASAPVVAASESESQIQIPFQASGTSISLSLESAGGRLEVGLPLRKVAPSIYLDRDGTPLVMNGDTGLVLDAANTARSGSRLQILATGLGAVKPEWPAGVPAPLQDAPSVLADVRVYLDREPVEVTRAILAPGYTGLYLIEVQIPRLVNAGSAELFVEAEGEISNRVQIVLEP